MSSAITFVWPGDIHIETADRPNYQTALWMTDEVNEMIKPDFVQFAGDNVQHATPEQFKLFNELCARLECPWYGLVGDHDAHHDPKANGYRAYVGETYGAHSRGGFRFIRLNTMEYKPLGLTPEQVYWFRYQTDSAKAAGEKIIVFQHHYPFQIWEDFRGPGIDGWREIVTTRPIEAIFAGHTHYGQIANDGHNVAIATRSIGDPEGGPAGYAVVHLEGEHLAVAYRSIEDRGPLLMITQPRDVMLCRNGSHIVSGPTPFHVRTWSRTSIDTARCRIDGGPWTELQRVGLSGWSSVLAGDTLSKGEHDLEVEAVDAEGETGRAQLRFMVDRSGRYTAYPRVKPEVTYTKYC